MIELQITHLGGLGDGIATHEGAPVYISLTAPGDRVRADIVSTQKGIHHAKLLEIIEPGPYRQTPPCRHFGTCGGCALQHLNPETYRAHKTKILTDILQKLETPISVATPLMEVPHHARRRSEFRILVEKGTAQVGFLEPESIRIVNLEECTVTHPSIIAFLRELRNWLITLRKPDVIRTISITVLSGKLDILFHLRTPFSPQEKQALAKLSELPHLMRIAGVVGEGRDITLYKRGEVTLPLAGIDVELPVGAFLQGTEEGQRAITEQVLEGLKGCTRVLDLYCGVGTYSIPLIQAGIEVKAYEGDPEMVAALHNAIRKMGKPGGAEARDLFKKPLTTQECSRFDGVVINPPRTGAFPQIKELVKHNFSTIVYVSCNPATFERDAAHILQNGYRLTKATPIDQFLYTPHLELVAVFEKS